MSNKSGAEKNWIRIKRKELWNKNKKCYYCNVETILPKRRFYYKITPNNLATLDHIYSKFDIRRFIKRNKVVLCCHKCNQEKAYRENCIMGSQTHNLLYGEPTDIRNFLN